MNLQEQIEALLAKAAPLRLLADDEAEAAGLPEMVNRINALRAKQAAAPCVTIADVVPLLGQTPQETAQLVAGQSALAEGRKENAAAAAMAFAGDHVGLASLQEKNVRRAPGRPRKAAA